MKKIDLIINEFYRSLKDYFKALVILMVINGIILAIGFKLIGIDLWWLKALGIALLDAIPMLGSGLIMIPWAIIKLAMGIPEQGMYLGILYVILVAVRLVGEPLIIGKKVGISPLISIGVTLVCIMAFGPVGAVIGGFLNVPLRVIWSLREKLMGPDPEITGKNEAS